MAKPSDFTNFATEHPNYFPGQFLLEDDFELQHKYLSDRQRYYNQALNVSGIIEGLEIEAIADKKAVKIKVGSAINGKGELIVIKQDILSFSDFKNLTSGELYIEYSEEKKVQQQEDFTRWQENPKIGFAATSPANSVKLAKLEIGDTIKVDVSIREYSGLSLPNSNNTALTLRSGGNANPNLAILTGSLKINGDFQCSNSAVTNILAIGDAPPTGNRAGNREWMKKGTKICLSSDMLFIGLKEEQGSDRKDAVIAWGDDPDDDFRFIHVQHSDSSEGKEVFRIKGNGNVGIGTNNPGEYKLNVQGNQFLKGSLTIQEGNFNLDGTKQIIFSDIGITNALKIQLWNGYGFGINPSTLFYIASGNHSWRDENNNERMLLTTGVNGGLTVRGTGTSSFAGNLTVNGAITPSAGSGENNGIMFPKDPGGGTLDAAWIRYYSRFPNSNVPSEKEQMTLEIGTLNDFNDHISLMPSGGVGIGTKTPTAKLEVQGGITKLEQEAWQTPTLQNKWENFGTVHNPAGYFKDSLGIVHLRGVVKNGNARSVIFQLPEGYRPSNQEVLLFVTNINVVGNVDAGAGRVDVLTNGQLLIGSNFSNYISLDGITFRAAPSS